MVTSKQIYRRACRRGHRLLGTYLVLAAWVNKVDCVILQRTELLPYLGLERMKNKRVDWLKDDIKKLFPFAESLVEARTNNYSSLYLSRVAFPDNIFRGWNTDQERINQMGLVGVPAAIVKIPEERIIIALLARAVHGVREFDTKG
jgi:hypothetical protein